DRDYPQRMSLVHGTDKILTHDFGEHWALYDLAADSAEQHDLSAEEPDKLEAMKTRWFDWFESTLRSRAGADYPQE
ncbi:MAG: hypothetical protein OQJ84_06955, partial [Xanthomonadales bacterium]|nr:hypothetical protein [Xanthomonadales bacterium]